jgi:hypothetical protein
MMLGFSEGFFVVISTRIFYYLYNTHLNNYVTDMKEIGTELFSFKFFTTLKDIAFSQNLQRTAICGDNCIKVVDVGSWKVTNVFDHTSNKSRMLQTRLY